MTGEPRKSLTSRHRRQPTFFVCEHPNVVVTADATVTLRCEARLIQIPVKQVSDQNVL